MPAVGLMLDPFQEGEDLDFGIEAAIKIGYRLIDCTHRNLNYRKVGNVFHSILNRKIVQREELFIIASYNNAAYRKLEAAERMERMIRDLQCEYVNVVMIDRPAEFDETISDGKGPRVDVNVAVLSDYELMARPIKKAFVQLDCEIVDETVLAVGLNGFSKEEIRKIRDYFDPAVVKLDISPYFQEKEIREYCERLGIIVIGYTSDVEREIPQGIQVPPPILENPIVLSAAFDVQRSPRQVVFRWFLDNAMAIVSRHGSRKKLCDILEIQNFHLYPSHMHEFDGMDVLTYSNSFQVLQNARNGVIQIPNLRMKNGRSIPQLGLATWHHVAETSCIDERRGLALALESGFRHIDCAQVYANLKDIGHILQKFLRSGHSREELFITSKVWNTYHSYDRCIEAVDESLADLQLDYLDLMLIHWPYGMKEDGGMRTTEYSKIDYLETWKALEQCVVEGKVRTIGVCNFNQKQLERLLEHAIIYPCVVQAELSVSFKRSLPILHWCRERDIVFEAMWPFGKESTEKTTTPGVNEMQILKEMSAQMHKTPRQIAIRWLLEKGAVVLPRGYKLEEQSDYLDTLNFRLSPEDARILDSTTNSYPTLNDGVFNQHHPLWPY
ncbi:unnamed protein product [Caenorhabditis sp. 36 PRJEB53466]|nr:unnamed protein product [Caenorhabditis sp. 36 PRJEB53466]